MPIPKGDSAAARWVQSHQEKVERFCLNWYCPLPDNLFEGSPLADYCSNKCRQQAWYHRGTNARRKREQRQKRARLLRQGQQKNGSPPARTRTRGPV